LGQTSAEFGHAVIYLLELLPAGLSADEGGASDVWTDFGRATLVAVYRPDAPGIDLNRAVVAYLIRRGIGVDLDALPAVCDALSVLCSEQAFEAGAIAERLLQQAEESRPSISSALTSTSRGPTASTIDILAVASFLDYVGRNWGSGTLRSFLVTLPQGAERAAKAAVNRSLSRLEGEWWKSLRRQTRAQSGGIGHFLRSSFQYLRPHWRRQLVILLGLGVQLAFQQILPRAQALLIDRAILPRDLHYLAALAVFLLALVALVLLAGVVSDYVRTQVSESVLKSLRERMFAQLQVLSHRFYSRMDTGDIISRFTSDLRSVEQALTNTLSSGLFLILSLILSTVHILLIDWTLAVIVLVSLPLFFVSTRLLGPPAQRASQTYSERNAAVTGVLQEDLAAQPVVKAFNLQATMFQRFSSQAQELYRSAVRLFFLSSLFGVSANLLTALVQVGVLGLGGFFVIQGRMPLGSLFEFLALLGLVIGPVQSLTGILQSIQIATASMDRVEEILNAEPDVRDAPNAATAGPLRRGLAFEGVSFSYRGDQPQLDGVTLEVPAGTSAAFVGPSGSGKSTLISLLTRFYDPDSGRILLDGVDARSVSLRSLRQQIAVVAQESFLFNTSIRENIRFGREDATDAEVEEAARLAEIEEIIQQLPQGYETVVGERGGNLSGGQRQRLAIARGIIRHPSILILDEATSALDPRTENAINHTLSSLARGRTTISVTHRLATAAAADRIFVLDNGRIVESGSHDDLMQADGLYRRMYEEQGNALGDGAQRALAASYLRGVPAFGDLPDQSLSELASALKMEHARAGQELIQAGEPGDRLYLIVSGEVEVLSPNSTEPAGVLATLGPGAYFGEIALLRDVPRTATVRARTELDAFSLDRDALATLLAANPWLRLQLEDVIEARETEIRALVGVAAVRNGAAVATLAVRSPLGGTKLLPLSEAEITIGRNPTNDIVINNERVSRFHARVRRLADGAYELRDSESTNGTFLGGQRVTEPVRLRDGDEMQIGDLTLVFRAAVPAAP
jgi:ATP-binding cassette subfamily B protein